MAKAGVGPQAEPRLGHIGSAAGGVLGVGGRRNFGTRPSARCELYGTLSVLHLDVGVAFPIPLVAATERLRSHVTTTVEHLTGLQVGRLDVELSWLHPDSDTRGDLL